MADEQKLSLDQKLNTLDDNLQPLKENVKDDPKDDSSEEPAKPDKDKKDEKAQDADEPNKDGADDSEAEPEDDSKADDEGYTIDEGEEEPESDEQEPSNSTERQNEGLTPEQQYILDNVQPLTVRGTIGDGAVKEYEVLAPEQLPQGFKFADDVEFAKATKGFAMLENRATQLQQDYRNQETQKANKEFKEREDTADRQDIAKMQREGLIPKFKAKPDSKEFDSDPGVKLAQEVIDFKEQMNQKYLDEYNAGRPYKHIGFEEAFAMFKRQNPSKDPAQAKEDKERLDIAKRTSRPSGNQQEAQKPRVHSGMTSRDLDTLISNLDWDN